MSSRPTVACQFRNSDHYSTPYCSTDSKDRSASKELESRSAHEDSERLVPTRTDLLEVFKRACSIADTIGVLGYSSRWQQVGWKRFLCDEVCSEANWNLESLEGRSWQDFIVADDIHDIPTPRLLQLFSRNSQLSSRFWIAATQTHADARDASISRVLDCERSSILLHRRLYASHPAIRRCDIDPSLVGNLRI